MRRFTLSVMVFSLLLLITSCTLFNTPPLPPSSPDPENGEIGVPLKPILTWNASDTDNDELTFDVYLSTDPTRVSNLDESVMVASDLTENVYKVEDVLAPSKVYYWKVVAKDTRGAVVEGPI